MAAPKGHPRWGGRAKGTPNGTTLQAKENIQRAFEALGGVDALVAWATQNEENKGIFYSRIYPRLIPHEVTGAGGGPLQFEDMTQDERRKRANRLKGILDAATAN